MTLEELIEVLKDICEWAVDECYKSTDTAEKAHKDLEELEK